MSALREAFTGLLGLQAGSGKLPQPAELERVARDVFANVAAQNKGNKEMVRLTDLYNYLVLETKAVVTKKTVDKLFHEMDKDKSGTVSVDEFVKALQKVCRLLARLEQQEKEVVPEYFVVPGSARMNNKVNLDLFKLQCVGKGSMRLLYDIFNEFDVDGTGVITFPEFKRYMQKHKPDIAKMSQGIFNSIDKNRKGTISFSQMLEVLFPEATPDGIRILTKMAKPKKGNPKIEINQVMLEEVKRTFVIYDDDKSGFLDREEFIHAVQQGGFTEEEAAECFDEIDTDQSGSVSYEEFEEWYIATLIAEAKLKEQESSTSSDV